MKKTNTLKIILVFTICIFVGLVGADKAWATTGAIGSSGDGGNASSGGSADYTGCVWFNGSSHRYEPYSYMFDLVYKSKKDKTYTRIASAVVGDYETYGKNNYYYQARDSLKFIQATGTLDNYKEIHGLVDLAKYMNSVHSVGGIGSKLTDSQGCEILNSFGVVELNYNNGKVVGCQLKEEFKDAVDPKKQSKNITDDFGYRILIQEFHQYSTKCNNDGRVVYMLRKESSEARWYSRISGTYYATHELVIDSDNVLGIQKYDMSGNFTYYYPYPVNGAYISVSLSRGSYFYLHDAALSDMMNGNGYNALWMDFSKVSSDKYKCKYNENDETCTIQKKKSDEKEFKDFAQNISCEGQSTYTFKNKTGDNETVSLENKCPKIERKCEEKKGEYGQCYIVTTKDGKEIHRDKVDCNSGRKGRTKYNGHTLDKACPYKPKFNYDADVACEGCKDDNTNGSYQIQDIADWEAILHSSQRTDKKDTLMAYYKKNGHVYCREAFNVIFPNKNNVSKIAIESGRYLTVNNPGSSYVNGAYNFTPIRVTRTTECISDNESALNGYNVNHSANNMGTVHLRYTENYSASKYGGTFELKPTLVDDSKTSTNTSKIKIREPLAGIGAGPYYFKTVKTTATYRLNENLYRYINTSGVSLQNATPPYDKYIDVGTANLPISFENEKGATISLNYQLPNNAKLIDVVKSGSVNYFGNDATIDNIYHDADLKQQSACYTLYATNTTKAESCAQQRLGANPEAAKKCLKEFGNADPNHFEYTCEIESGGPNSDCKTQADAARLHRSWNPEGKYCCPSGTKYDYTTKECKPTSDSDCKTADDARRLNRDWNNAGGYCCPVGTKYNGTTRKCEPANCRKVDGKCYDDTGHQIDCDGKWWKDNCTCYEADGYWVDKTGEKVYTWDDYSRSCSAECDPTKDAEIRSKLKVKECGEEFDKPCSYERCPYTGLCPMPGGVCPGTGGKIVIYRVIDLIDPFPAQDASTRETGTNWCTVENGVYKCGGKPTKENQSVNEIVYNEIVDNRKETGYDIYGKDPLYEVTLDADTIAAVKRYNRHQGSYDDWETLEYSQTNGSYSPFLHGNASGRATVTLSNRSVCRSMLNGNIKTCAER